MDFMPVATIFIVLQQAYCPMILFWYNGPMKKNWGYPHIIDLEYFFHQDAEIDHNKLRERDRNIFLNTPQEQNQNITPDKSDRRELIQLWLTARINNEFAGTDKLSPGTIFRDSLRLANTISILKGIIVGLIAGLTFFTYTGTTPVNVFYFLLFFVVPQLLFVVVLVAVYLAHLLSPSVKLPSFYSIFFRGVMARLISIIHRQWLRNFSADKRGSVSHALGTIRKHNKIYGSLFYWPIFILSQLFAIGFNLGLLTLTLLKILASDLAFGWQSTLQISADAIYHAVKTIALPWSWLLPKATGFPSLTEIEGSQIILKEGIYHLATQDLIAWWPFLICCLFFYGLALRSGLFIVGKIIEKRTLNVLNLDTPACISLIQRMLTPILSTQAVPEHQKNENQFFPDVTKKNNLAPGQKLRPQVVLIPDDIFDFCSTQDLTPFMQDKGLSVLEIHRFMISYDTDQKLKQLLASRSWEKGEGLLLLMEGWMPPLVDVLTYLKDLRQLLPENNIIHLALIGRPGKTLFTPVTSGDFSVWQNKITPIGDPYLNLFTLVSDHNIS